MRYRLAQVNVARMRAPFSAPTLAGLTARIDEMNELAERSPGFVWRFQAPPGDLAYLDLFARYCGMDDPERVFFNMSVWESVDALHTYVFRTAHRELLQEHARWIEPLGRPALALWWIPEGRRPSPSEAWTRLQILGEQGPTAEAFTFAQRFPAPDDPAFGVP